MAPVRCHAPVNLMPTAELMPTAAAHYGTKPNPYNFIHEARIYRLNCIHTYDLFYQSPDNLFDYQKGLTSRAQFIIDRINYLKPVCFLSEFLQFVPLTRALNRATNDVQNCQEASKRLA
jgi:hypothetical protein